MVQRSYWFGALLICTLVAYGAAAKAEPLHEAAFAGDTARVKQLLDEGGDVNAPDALGTPLQWALLGNRTEVVGLLLESGADAHIDGPSGTSLQAAVLNDNAGIVRLLLEHGVDPNRGEGARPLIVAAQKGSLEITQLLLAQKADPSFRTFDGITALHEAAKRGHLEIAKKLVDEGAHINAVTAMSEPPLHFAVIGNHHDLINYLKAQGAAPGAVAPITNLLASADPAEGKSEAKLCASCHKFQKSENSRGPSLWDVVGRPKGGVGDFDYSPAFDALEGEWTFEALNEFLRRPADIIPGTAMEFGGISEPQIRANLIAYLRTLSDAPVPLP